MKDYYSKLFFENQMNVSLLTAEEVAPLVLQYVRTDSVVDVGCGIGTWLSVFKKHGVSDILGIDGDWVDKKMLLIPSDNFIMRDLAKPIEVGKIFDLVVSLEVAEHLHKEYAETFINSLTKLGNAVLFSAAIPNQGGKHHVNEQWPEYWATLFNKHDFVLIDTLRKKIWNNPKVGCWYAQNIFLYVKKDLLNNNPILLKEYQTTDTTMLSLVHPQLFLAEMERYQELRKNYDLIKKALLPVWWLGKLTKKLFQK